MTTGKVLLGVLAGAAAGALIGVLLAPDKGTETRRKISKNSGETMDELKSMLETLVAGFTQKFGEVKEEAEDFAGKVKNKTGEFRKDGATEFNKTM